MISMNGPKMESRPYEFLFHNDSMDMSLSKLQELMMDRETCRAEIHKELDTTERLN